MRSDFALKPNFIQVNVTELYLGLLACAFASVLVYLLHGDYNSITVGFSPTLYVLL